MLDLGNHDLILGSRWFKYYDVKPDLRRRRLEWPASLPASPHYAREIRRSLPELYNEELEVAAAHHQTEVYRRDRAFAREDQQRAAGRASQVSVLAQAPASPERLPDLPSLPREIQARGAPHFLDPAWGIQNTAAPKTPKPGVGQSKAPLPLIFLKPGLRSPKLPLVP